MEHFYKTIHGYFNYEDFFKRHVELSEGTFVEIGCFLGCSSAYLATEIINSNKDITLYCVDTWAGMSNDNGEDAVLNKRIKDLNGNAFSTFIKNVEPCIDVIRPIVGDSTLSSYLFEDDSVDFLFIDAGHQYWEVYNDIEKWLPKIKPGGYISGHDYGNLTDDPVKKAVDNHFGDKVKVYGSCWEVRIGQ